VQHGRCQRDTNQNQEYQKYSEDHQSHGNGGGEQNAQGAGAHASRRPYATKIRNVISHLAHAYTEYRSPGLVEREVKRVGLIVVSTDRGLCGGLNTNLFKTDHCCHAAMA
jgi:hypothetical protein